MAQTVLDSIYLLIVTITLFMIHKYVFFEPDLGVRKQRILYVVSFLVGLIVMFVSNESNATLAIQLMVGINIFLARKKHRFLGFLVAFIPLAGIGNGLLTLISFLPYAVDMSEQTALIYQYVFCGVLLLLAMIFYVKGKSWRSWFDENMQYRSLDKSERWLLWAVGIMMQVFVMAISQMTSYGYNTESRELSEQMSLHLAGGCLELFFMTAVIIGLVVQGNKQSFEYKKITGMQSGMITLMADIVENRDGNTGGHIKRTARYVEGIAKELKKRGAYQDILTDGYMKDLVVAAPLHDIGKIHVPDAVLNKPGRLTDEEFALMKDHTTAGHDLLVHAKEELGEYAYLTMALEMATYHHEWWNGKGYPYGVRGNDIPLCARIMAVADVFDALISKRCYKEAMPLEKAYAIIREESGTHFEPEIVDAFFAVVNDMVADESNTP